jgi:hypothetical protein
MKKFNVGETYMSMVITITVMLKTLRYDKINKINVPNKTSTKLS